MRRVDRYLVQVDQPGYGVVIRIHPGQPPTLHHIQNWACDCESWKFRKDCSHIEHMMLVAKGEPIDAEKAWGVIAQVIEDVQYACHRVWFDHEVTTNRGVTELYFKVQLPFPKWKRVLAKWSDPGPLVVLETIECAQ